GVAKAVEKVNLLDSTSPTGSVSGANIKLTSSTAVGNIGNEVQQINLGGTPNGGTFALSAVLVNGTTVTTPAIVYTGVAATTASNIQAALNASGVYGAGAVSVSGASAVQFNVTFGGSAVAGKNIG